MKIVGDELSILASSRHGSDDFDLLGRSAYNRYYYSAYLITRQTVGQMRSDWKRISHAGLPTLLDSALINVVKSHLERQRRTNLITQGQYSRLLSDNGVIITDNLSFHGLVEDSSLAVTRNQRGLVRKIKNFIEFLDNNLEFVTTYVDVGDKISISKRK